MARQGAMVGGRYRLVRRLSNRREATTWLARDEERGDHCVVKILSLGGDLARGLREEDRHEVEALRAVKDPHVAHLRDFVLEKERGVAAIVMDRVEGSTLEAVVARGALPREDIVRILVDCARGLGALHSRGLLHRDLHPRNVIVGGKAGSRTAVIVDLGLAAVRPRDLKRSVTGTMGFVSPESVLSGAPDARSDLYSLGCILYFLVLGEAPSSPKELLDELVKGGDPFARFEKRARTLIPEPFGPVVGRLIARYPAARFQSASEVIAAVNLRFGTSYPVETAESRRPLLAEPPLIGRTREKRAVFRCLLGKVPGRPVAALTGREGIGRTRLLESILRAFELKGSVLLRVRPGPGEGPRGTALLGALRSLEDRVPPGARADLDEAEEALRRGEEGAAVLALGRAFAAAVETFPDLLVAVDDADHLDRPSLEVLGRILSDPGGHRGAVLVVLPEEEGPAGRREVGRLRRLLREMPGFLEVAVGPLATATAEELVRILLPVRNLTADAIRRIAEAGAGHPASLLEIVRDLLEGGRVSYGADGWVLLRPSVALPVPKDAREAAARRLAGLAPAARGALDALALLGGRVPAATWAVVLRETEADGGGELLERGFVAPTGDGSGVQIASEVFRQILLERLAPGDRALLAGRLSLALSGDALLDPVTRVRLLLDAGRPGEAVRWGAPALGVLNLGHRVEEALELSASLVEAALATPSLPGAFPTLAEAVRLSHREGRAAEARRVAEAALPLAPGPEERRPLLVLLADIEAAAGRSPDALIQCLREDGAGPEERARAGIARARFLYNQDRMEECRRTLEEILPTVAHLPTLRMQTLTGLTAVLNQGGLLGEARAARDEALRTARITGDRGSEAVLLVNAARAETRASRFKVALRMALEGTRSLGVLGSDGDEVDALLDSVAALESLGRWRRARLLSARVVELATETGKTADLANGLRRLARALGMLGSHEESLRAFTRAFQAAEGSGMDRLADASACAMAAVLVERGELPRAGVLLAEQASLTRKESPYAFVRGVLGFRIEPPEDSLLLLEVRRLLASPLASAWPDERRDLRVLEVEALHRLGREEEARRSLDDLVRSARRQGAADTLAKALAMTGTVHAGDPAAALRGMGCAHRVARRLENTLVRATVLEACGMFFLDRPGGKKLAEECLGEAASLLGTASLSERAETLTTLKRDAASPPGWRGLRPEKLAWVLEQTEKINQVENPEDVLAALLDAAIAFTGAERGFLVLASRDGFEVRFSRAIDASELGPPETSLSYSLLRTAIEKGESVVSANAQGDQRFVEYFSVRNLQLRSVLVVPIRRGSRVLGAFYLDNRFLESVFADQDRMALEQFASQAGLAFENVSYRAEVRSLAARLQSKVEEQTHELDEIRTTVRSIQRRSKYEYREIFRGSGAMAETLRLVDRAVDSEVPIVLEGESGTGKELVARAIHFHGPLRDRPFVVLNCAAIPETLIEAELFGHRKGAFTGAHEDREGVLAEADGGTLFLDEVGELPLSVQPKFLRAVQFGEYTPLGSPEALHSRFRLVSATHRDLREMVGEKEFREDLYYRISVFPIRIPPLRERMEDLPELAASLLRRFTAEAGKGPRRLSRRAVARLLQHEWPGNIRELENVLRRAVLMTPGDTVAPEDLVLESTRSTRESGLLDRIRATVAGGLSPREELALRRVMDRGRLALREFVGQARVSRATATRDLRRLVALRLLVRRGSTAAAHYELSPRFADDDSATPGEPSVTRDA